MPRVDDGGVCDRFGTSRLILRDRLTKSMCGICGIFSNKPLPDLRARLQCMSRRMEHRGPDQRGVVTDPRGAPGGLGACRLAVVEEDCPAPTLNHSGVHVALNGQIYNYPELRHELTLRGARFRTRTDIEALLHAYLIFGEQCFARLEGMFAAVVWDQNRGRLLLARDRLGQKPLFYHQGPDGLVFASELKALLASGLVDFRPSAEKVHDFLALGYTPGPHAALEGVSNLVPGTYLSVDTSDPAAALVEKRYWRLNVTESADLSDPHEEFLALFDAAVSRRLMSDRPVGVFLSAGIDSMAVLHSMRRHVQYPITALTASFSHREFDETPAVGRSLPDGVAHEVVRCEPQHVIQDLEQMIAGSDNLLSNPAMIPLFGLSRRARELGLKCVLTGGGADELLFGYPTYLADRVSHGHRLLDTVLQRAILPTAARLVPVRFGRMPTNSYVIRKYMETREMEPALRHFWWRTIFTLDDQRRTYARTYQPIMEDRSIESFHNRASLADLTIWWRDMGLYMADCICMANSVESRAPFMDHRLVEFVFSLPVRLKMRGIRSKPFLRRALRPLLPWRVRRRPKLSFEVPLSSWLADDLHDFVSDLLSGEAASRAGVPEQIPVRRILDEHRAREQDHAYRIWSLVCLVRWHEMMRGQRGP